MIWSNVNGLRNDDPENSRHFVCSGSPEVVVWMPFDYEWVSDRPALHRLRHRFDCWHGITDEGCTSSSYAWDERRISTFYSWYATSGEGCTSIAIRSSESNRSVLAMKRRIVRGAQVHRNFTLTLTMNWILEALFKLMMKIRHLSTLLVALDGS